MRVRDDAGSPAVSRGDGRRRTRQPRAGWYAAGAGGWASGTRARGRRAFTSRAPLVPSAVAAAVVAAFACPGRAQSLSGATHPPGHQLLLLPPRLLCFASLRFARRGVAIDQRDARANELTPPAAFNTLRYTAAAR